MIQLGLERNLPVYAISFSLALPRLLGVHLGLPMFSSAMIPGMARGGFIGSLAIFMIPLLNIQGQGEIDPSFVVVLMLKELLLGFILGYLSGLMFWAAQAAGDLIAFQSGMSMASFFDPTLAQESTAFGTILRKWAEVLFFMSGAYTLLLGAVFESYKAWPVRSFFPAFDLGLARMAWEAVSAAMATACVYAFPALAAMFLITVCLGLISRFAPSLNAFFLAMPLQSMTASFLLAVGLPVFAYLFRKEFSHFEDVFRALKIHFGT